MVETERYLSQIPGKKPSNYTTSMNVDMCIVIGGAAYNITRP